LTPALQATTRHWRAFLRIASNLGTTWLATQC